MGRGSAPRQFHGARLWQPLARTALAFLVRHLLCRPCELAGRDPGDRGRSHPAAQGRSTTVLGPNNWQSICKSCHSTKTAREDGRRA